MLYFVGILCLLATVQAKSFGEDKHSRRQISSWSPYPADYDLKLSHVDRGRVEIAYLGQWHSICDADFDNVDATVACKQLGYAYGRKEARGAFGFGERRTLLDHLACSGVETRLIDCYHTGIQQYWCDASYDAATVTCSHTPFYPQPQPQPQPQPRPQPGAPAHGGTMVQAFDIQSIKLTDGPSAWEGLVQVQVANQWHYVCTNNWDSMDAKVACRMLGSQQGIAVTPSPYNYYLQIIQIQNMWMDSFSCAGSENALDQCPSMGYNRFSTNCVDKGMIAAAKCDAGAPAPPAETQVKLEGGRTLYDGVVKCYHGNEWYPICADDFTELAAQVVCNQLFGRYTGMVGTPVLPISGQSNAYYMRGFYDIRCQGYESSLTECFSNFINNAQRRCVQGDATVICTQVYY